MYISRSFLIIICVDIIAARQWVDPHSMDTKVKNKLPNSSEDILEQNSQKCIHTVKKQCSADIHLKRIVRLILSNAHLDRDVGYHEGYINIRLSPSEHQLLLDFAKNQEAGEAIFSEISSIFETAFQKPASERYPELILSIQEKIYGLIFNPTSTALASACLALYLTYKLLRAQFTWKSIVKYFFFLAYVADFAVTYVTIVEEEEIESMVTIKKLGTVPPECDPQKMSWWTFIKTQFESTFVENPCKAYYQATYQKYWHFVAPSKILTRQFRTLIVEPFGDIGEAFGKFGRGMFTSLPWGLNVVIFPVMLLTVCALIFMVFLFITKPHFKISLFHLFTIELGQNVRNDPPLGIQNEQSDRRQIEYGPNRVRNRRNRNNRREVGNTTNHRPLIEEVSNKNSSSNSDGQTEKHKQITDGKKDCETQMSLPEKDNEESNLPAIHGNSNEKE